MEPEVHNFLCFSLASAVSAGESYLGHFRLSRFLKGAALAKDLPPFCFSEEDLRFHVKRSTGCFVRFRHKFNYSYDEINIWEK